MGNNIDPEIMEECGCTWAIPYIKELFLQSIDTESSNILHLPYQGSILEQPYRMWQFFERCRNVFMKVKADRIRAMRG